MASYSVECRADKAEQVWSALQEMGCFSQMWRQVSADATVVTITLECGREMRAHHHERLAQLMVDGDAIKLYLKINEEELRQWQEQQVYIERLDG